MAKLTDEVRFRAWMVGVDREIENLCGLGHRDLGDQMWRDWFDAKMSTRSAAHEALDNEGFFKFMGG